jgi:hypothetical protein
MFYAAALFGIQFICLPSKVSGGELKPRFTAVWLLRKSSSREDIMTAARFARSLSKMDMTKIKLRSWS